MNKIKELIAKKDWDVLISLYSVKDICLSLDFIQTMRVIKHLFYDNIQDDEKQQYALNLAFEAKNHFDKEWQSDWKNEVFLGGLCDMQRLYDERYFCYKRAYDKLKDPPAELLLLLFSCYIAPGTPPITQDESEFYLKKAVEKKITSEAALAMRGFYRYKKGGLQEEEYWDRMYKKLENENVHFEAIVPDVLKI